MTKVNPIWKIYVYSHKILTGDIKLIDFWCGIAEKGGVLIAPTKDALTSGRLKVFNDEDFDGEDQQQIIKNLILREIGDPEDLKVFPIDEPQWLYLENRFWCSWHQAYFESVAFGTNKARATEKNALCRVCVRASNVLMSSPKHGYEIDRKYELTPELSEACFRNREATKKHVQKLIKERKLPPDLSPIEIK